MLHQVLSDTLPPSTEIW